VTTNKPTSKPFPPATSLSARMKAVRDLCGGIAMPEVREVLEWVVAEDPWLRDRAAHCLDGAAER